MEWLFAVREYPLTGFSISIEAPGTTAPEGSITVPPMLPEALWALADPVVTANIKPNISDMKRMNEKYSLQASRIIRSESIFC